MPKFGRKDKKMAKYSLQIHFKHPLVIAFAIVAFWRGLWGLLDTYLFPDNQLLSLFASLLLGLSILYFNDFNINEIKDG